MLEDRAMTLAAAYALLEARWPGRSFMIGLEVWKHAGGLDSPSAEWSVYAVTDRVHYRGGSLEHAMEAALGCDADLAALDQQVGGFPEVA
jgi:hypothetical protein